MKTLDACGISCPEPLLMLKKSLKTEKEVILLLDSKSVLDSCVDYAKKQRFSVNININNNIYKVETGVAK